MLTYSPPEEDKEIFLLEELLKRYSPTYQEQEAVEVLIEAMRQWGFDTHIDEVGNAIGSIGNGTKEIIMLGHIDTVEGNIPVQRQGDLLFGRGSVDAKGPLACFTSAAARLGFQTDWKLTVIGAVGEEGDSRGAKYLCHRYQPNFLIIGEPSGWERIALGYKGSAWCSLTAKQYQAHYAAAAKTACDLVFDAWASLRAYAHHFNQNKPKVFDQLTATLTEISSHNDGFEQTAAIKLNLRLPPDFALEDMLTALAFDENIHIHIEDEIQAYRAEKNSPLVRAFLSAIRAAGGQPGFTLKSGTSDMNIVAPIWNCPTVAYGPGDSSLDHTPHEHISITEYKQSINILEKVLRQICSQN
jgi:LysW-gamma-L-lysine carboxypeptidase